MSVKFNNHAEPFVTGIDIASIYDLSIEFWNRFDRVVVFGSHLIFRGAFNSILFINIFYFVEFAVYVDFQISLLLFFLNLISLLFYFNWWIFVIHFLKRSRGVLWDVSFFCFVVFASYISNSNLFRRFCFWVGFSRCPFVNFVDCGLCITVTHVLQYIDSITKIVLYFTNNLKRTFGMWVEEF